MLGSYGLWDPIEIQHADVAQEVAKSGSFRDVTVGGRFSPRPVLYVWLVALGFRTLGVSELAGRLPLALCSLLALLLAYRVVRKLVGEKAGLIVSFVLATTPAFLFQARQLASEAPTYASLLASLGGLAAFLWPVDGKRCRIDLAVGALGLVAGFLSEGLVLGFVFPIACLGLAVLLSLRTRSISGAEGPWTFAAGPDLEEGTTLGAALRRSAVPLLLALAAAGVTVGLLLATLKGRSFLLLGGEYRRTEAPPGFDTFFRDLGFGFFPWFGVLPVALARFVWGQRTDPAQRPHVAFPQMLTLVVVAGAYVLGTFWAAYFGPLRYPALPWLAVCVGLLLFEAVAAPSVIHRAWGVVTAGFVLVLQQDFFMEPQSLAFSHLVTSVKYPIELIIKYEVRLFGVLLATLLFLTLGGTPGVITADSRARRVGPLVNGLARCLDNIGAGLRALGGKAGQRFWYALLATALVFAGWCGFYLLPHLSLHLSNKALFETYHRCRIDGERLAQYQVPGRGAAYYNKGQVDQIGDQARLFSLLREPRRSFVLIPSSYLASIDQAARQAGVTYHVLDDRNSQYLIISNRLGGACAQDLNPLRRFVLSKPPKPRKVVKANFENKVELIGYDVADAVSRGGKFKITLYFHVLARMPAGYKIFIHFDQPANRFHGDHDPLDGKLPTQYWLPGDYIVDPHDVEIPLITTPSGPYTMYMGFWLGEGRLKVIQGPNDGVNRVQLGTLRVR
jgi:4-amino-4-deoxy-L-arabinose transferase-like glycosyltransferase